MAYITPFAAGVIKTVFTPSVELTLYRSDMADWYTDQPEIERVAARTVRRKIDGLLDVCPW